VQRALRLPGHQEEGPASQLWFTNLLRVASKDGGRPKSALHRAQLPAATLLLQEEIMRAAPERLLFLTGWDYLGDLRDELGVAWEPGESSGYAERAGFLHLGSARDISVVVAMHPQGLPEGEWVQSVQEAFARVRTEGFDRQSTS
jgi:hypothetical protein